MNRNTLFAIAACALLVFGSGSRAVAGVGQGAIGRGIVATESGQIGEFQFKAHKAIGNIQGNEMIRVGGHAAFRTVLPDHARVEINCKNVRHFVLGDDKRSAEFSGPAMLFVLTPRGVTRVAGVLAWRVVDRGRPGPNNPPDLAGVRFIPDDGSQEFNFGGAVVRGDVRVFEVTDTRP